MRRRQFIGGMAGALSAGVWAGLGANALALAGTRRASVSKPLDAAQYHASRRYAKTRFGEIAYIERGSGPAVLFLHG
ncbi:MAG: alpha/beta fold hydrolase, partial [Lysobacter sp.]